MSFTNNCAIIFIEVLEPGKAGDVRYITVGSSDINKTDSEFEQSAIAYFKAGSNYQAGTKFVLKGVEKFKTKESYIMFLENQISDYLSTDN